MEFRFILYFWKYEFNRRIRRDKYLWFQKHYGIMHICKIGYPFLFLFSVYTSLLIVLEFCVHQAILQCLYLLVTPFNIVNWIMLLKKCFVLTLHKTIVKATWGNEVVASQTDGVR